MSNAVIRSPNGWGKDSLTKFFDIYRGNQYGTFVNKRDAVANLIRIDRLYERFLDGAMDPSPLWPMGFFLRAHSAYRAAAGAVLGGQIFEIHALLRLCLELGAYGFYIGADEERYRLWLERHNSPDAKQAVRDEFGHGKIKKHIRDASEEIGTLFESLYDSLIDSGAHPNERGFSMGSEIREIDGNVHFNTIYLHGDGPPLDIGLKTTGLVGLWVLRVAQLIYPAKFRLLGIENELIEIRKR